VLLSLCKIAGFPGVGKDFSAEFLDLIFLFASPPRGTARLATAIKTVRFWLLRLDQKHTPVPFGPAPPLEHLRPNRDIYHVQGGAPMGGCKWSP